jgi:hypothetical protein
MRDMMRQNEANPDGSIDEVYIYLTMKIWQHLLYIFVYIVDKFFELIDGVVFNLGGVLETCLWCPTWVSNGCW